MVPWIVLWFSRNWPITKPLRQTTEIPKLSQTFAGTSLRHTYFHSKIFRLLILYLLRIWLKRNLIIKNFFPLGCVRIVFLEAVTSSSVLLVLWSANLQVLDALNIDFLCCLTGAITPVLNILFFCVTFLDSSLLRSSSYIDQIAPRIWSYLFVFLVYFSIFIKGKNRESKNLCWQPARYFVYFYST